jgi:murein DD-endopeptidase MepM/ murein hydrolase activator NlpD
MVVFLLGGLSFIATPGWLAAGEKWTLDPVPVQVRVLQPARDFDHEKSQDFSKLLIPMAMPDAVSQPQAESPGFLLPLRRGLSNMNPGIFTIAGFVDHDDVMGGSLLDWNCGGRTYDTEDFNHPGTDYNSAHFPWLTMANDGLVVVAAADGTIIQIHDGEPDQQCAFDDRADANWVALRHDDGTITIYAHMKNGSMTPRNIGHRVEEGDYLGVMGSSGFSSGVHLHFEVQDTFNNLYDPYAGACNALNVDSFWEEQESYHEKEVLSVSTHSALPEYPPCPQQEVPHYQDVFSPDDDIYLSVNMRDFEGTDSVDLVVRDSSGAVVLETTFSDGSVEFRSNLSLTWGPVGGNPTAEDKYSYTATYAGQTETHEFYVGSGPDPAPAAVPANNAYAGLWYDPSLDGEGFNFVPATGGTIVYFYGSDNRGNRIWLISDLIPGEIKTGRAISVLMFESTGGVFSTPVSSARGLSAWGTLALLFSACDQGQSVLNGADGYKESTITKLAGVSGASCVGGDVPSDAPWAGLWYDPSRDGEGYNLIVAPPGRILYFYGFKLNGQRLWAISELITETLEVGKTIEVRLFEASEGTFSEPVPSSESLVEWGTAEITVIDCDTVTIVIQGTDGTKTSNTVRLAGIIGLGCPG